MSLFNKTIKNIFLLLTRQKDQGSSQGCTHFGWSVKCGLVCCVQPQPVATLNNPCLILLDTAEVV